jgi:exodeoxyribonuclease VII large subunit
MGQLGLEFGAPNYTVTGITSAIRASLQRDFRGVWVDGEVTEAKLAPSGHWYFSLKDSTAKIRCVCYRSAAWKLRVKPSDGLQVTARGSVDLYEARGECQFIVEALQPRGLGELQLAFDQLKQRLAAEGLFDAARKRPLPPYPQRIGIVTSPAGAVLQDLLEVLTRRFPGLHIRVYPAQVQGAGSGEQIRAGLDYFRNRPWAELVILARGGGSLEDLWSFNEEIVARGIAACPVPVISAVGHETDFTIADFTADLRAPTPSAAAELAVVSQDELLGRFTAYEELLRRSFTYLLARSSERLHRLGIERARSSLGRRIGRAQQRADELDFRLRDLITRQLRDASGASAQLQARLEQLNPRTRLTEARARLDRSQQRLNALQQERVARMKNRLASLESELAHLSPLAILARGYAIVHRQADHALVTGPMQVEPRDILEIQLSEGTIQAEVTRSGDV